MNPLKKIDPTVEELHQIFFEMKKAGQINCQYYQVTFQNLCLGSFQGHTPKGWMIGIRNSGHFYIAKTMRDTTKFGDEKTLTEFLAHEFVPDDVKNFVILYQNFFLKRGTNL